MSTASIRAPTSPVLDRNQKQLAAYLARARGPGETSINFNLRSRLSGEAARIVFTDYEAPPDPDVGMPYKVLTNNGTDWSMGTPSYVYPGFGVHDAWIDADGASVYFTCNVPNNVLTLGKFNLKTGAFAPPQGRCRQRAGGAGPRHDPRPQWHHLVQRQSRQGRSRQARHQDRPDRGVHPAPRHGADRRRHHGRL
jgi:hypothetical protein